MDEVREVLADVVIAHVPVVKFDFRQKVTYLAVMLRRLMGAVMDPSQTDDRCEIVTCLNANEVYALARRAGH